MRVLGHHELLIRLASGGAANVFLTRDVKAPPPGRLLALKVLLPQLAGNDDFLRMFFTEAKIASRLQHPNVVQIAGFGQVEGIHCLAMEYIFGASLAQVLRASGRAKRPLTVGVLLRITAQVCDALHAAHELLDEHGQPMGLVHRDVTPQNILIGFNGVPKLTDFGIAKATDRGWETQAGIVKGKFSYMAPEQAMGKRVDRRTDIFCTGIVLWEALTGQELFKGSTPLEVIENIRKQTIPPPSKVVPGLSSIVDPIVMKALRRTPRQRYQTAGEMRDAIETLIERAGVQIDAKTISQEFAEIFGDIIYKRAFALRAAMAGNADLDELAELLGGGKLREEHLPFIPGGANNPDPLGLFSESEPMASESIFDTAGGVVAALPARSEEPFDDVDIEFDEEAARAENTAEAEPIFEAAEETEPPDSVRAPDLASFQSVQGWDDSTRMMAPEDDLLSMLSEEDATIGLVPDEWKQRFGGSMAIAEVRDPVPSAGFGDDEETIDASRLHERFDVSAEDDPIEQTISDEAYGESTMSDDRALAPVYDAKAFQSRVVRDELESKPARSASSHRPVPRAPSLDLSPEDLTPAPELEVAARPVAPSAKKKPTRPPPPPPSTRVVMAEPKPLGYLAADDADPPVMPGELDEPPPGELPRRPPRSSSYQVVRSSVPPAPGSSARGAPQRSASSSSNGAQGFGSTRPQELSASALRQLAADGSQVGSQRPSTGAGPVQSAPVPAGQHVAPSNPQMMMPGQSSLSNPGYPRPMYMSQSHPGYMVGPHTPSSQHNIVVQRPPSVLRPILFGLLAVMLIAAGVLLGIVLMQYV